ncbi:MAG TPA: DsrE family protein [Gemmatimonadaceae bacterium]|nr:DsrE family protein [Gemmatimonadaceae bacterium]
MHVRAFALALVAMVAVASTAAAQQPAGFWTYPAIKDYGPVHVWPQAGVRPDANTTYKAVFDLTQPAKEDQVNPGLEKVARTVNAFAAVGTSLSHLKFVVIVHGPATPIVLGADEFQAKYGHANPNLAIIEALKKAGVDVKVCGNALGEFQFTPADLNPDVSVALSALSTLVILQNEGYALVSM